jgi:DNA-binding transcriptional LysR family regulator
MRGDKSGSPVIYDLWALEVYLTVCELGSMTLAAKRLRLTQPAVSKVVRQLENLLGVQLLDRKLTPLRLTPAGAMLRQRSRQLLDDARQIAPAVRQISNVQFPLLRFGIVESVASILTPALASDMRSVAAQIAIWNGLSPEHSRALLDRSVDIIITSDELDDVDGLERHSLLGEPFVLLLPKSIPSSMGLAELAKKLPLIRHSARSHMGIQIERHIRRLGLDVPRHQESDSSASVVAMVTAGLGWTITTPLCVMEARPPSSKVALHPLPPPGFSRRLTLVTRAGELGVIPEQIADLARRILRDTCLPELRQLVPWTTDALRIG